MNEIQPVCWLFDWPLPELEVPAYLKHPWFTEEDRTEEMARLQLKAWQTGRCAVCGRLVPDRLVEDHDHATGLTRGYLCGSCNLGEGVNRHYVFELYRQRPPTKILGVAIRYIDFFTRRPAEPITPIVDRWSDNAVKGIGL